jgi:hypothetical protein
MATQAIREFLKKIHPRGDEMFKMLADTRNHLTHGGSHEILRDKIGMDLSSAVDVAGETAWHAPKAGSKALFRPYRSQFRAP